MAVNRGVIGGAGVEVDELHVDHTDDDASLSPGRQDENSSRPQSDSMRNLLIVESAGRSTAFVVEALVTLVLAAGLLILSMASVIVVPLMYLEVDERIPIRVDLHNGGAYGLWVPFLAVAGGTLMLKAARTGHPKYFALFYYLCLVTTVCCAAIVLQRSLYYACGWYQSLLDQSSLLSNRQFCIQIACDAICAALLIEGAVLLAVYLKLFWRHSCGTAASAQLRRGSCDNRNLFV